LSSDRDLSYNSDDQLIDLRTLLKVIRKRFIIITILTLLFAGAGYYYSFYILKPYYNAKTLLLVTQATDTVKSQSTREDNLNSIINDVNRTPILTMNTYVGVIKSEALMTRVIRKMDLLKMGYTPRYLASQISTTVTKDSYLIEVTVNNSDPDLAVKIANTLSRELIAMMTERNNDLIDRSVKYLQDQAEAIKEELQKTTNLADKNRLNNVLALLSEGITNAQIARNLSLGGANLVVVSPAMNPYLIMPERIKIITVAFIIGLMVSMGISFIFELMKDTTEPEKKEKTEKKKNAGKVIDE